LTLEQIDLLFTGSKVAMRIEDVEPDAEMAFSRTGSVVGATILPPDEKDSTTSAQHITTKE
jgi:hypothetical protein